MTNDLFAVWKPKGPTSQDIVREVKKLTKSQRVGHAGTLDPLAEGVLVVGIGRDATRRLHVPLASEKEYEASVRLGARSATDDAQGPIEEIATATPPNRATVERVLHRFTGIIEQVPPAYSAVKVRGQEAYKRARRGEVFAVKARPADVKSIELIRYEWPRLELRVVTGPGVYIRALARDIGAELKTGAYLSGLVRTRVGEFTRADAVTLEELKQRHLVQ